MKKILIAGAVLAQLCGAAYAADVSKEEEAKIVEALKAIGCEIGEIEKEKDGYEVDDAQCKTGQTDIKLNTKFEITKKKGE
ncbi:MAG: hypothetical protein NW215_00965 [Hyphomicrobiales bacterium]|nr:hypothetical protein [Hyphomicrobiales bacterium]